MTLWPSHLHQYRQELHRQLQRVANGDKEADAAVEGVLDSIGEQAARVLRGWRYCRKAADHTYKGVEWRCKLEAVLHLMLWCWLKHSLRRQRGGPAGQHAMVYAAPLLPPLKVSHRGLEAL